jgi:hypothetical protein
MAAPVAWRRGPPHFPGVERGGALHHLLHQAPRLGPLRAPRRADHARRNGVVESAGLADRDREMADAQPGGVTEVDRVQIRLVDADDRQATK